ncbi:MAG: ATP-grasp domain-containing protein [Methanofollis sp.]|nr:ATP-grasp domain-containing protein [Methanofollis sp.]
MRAFLAEYTVFHDPDLAVEGRAMLKILSESFARCGYEVVSPRGGDLMAEIEDLAPDCDVGLVIAPDHLLAPLTKKLEDCTRNIGCGSMNIALCANKKRSLEVLAAHGIPVPAEKTDGLKVVKPVRGCDTYNTRLTEAAPGPDEIGQEYIEGEPMSVSLIGSRIVGEACLYFSGAEPLVLSLNRQKISLGEDGYFAYHGGETPVDHPMKDEIIKTAVKAATVLGCQGYVGVDLIVGDRPYVLEVNPRMTTSMVGIAVCMEEEIASLLVDASCGKVPANGVHLKGRVEFDREGRVTPL